MEEFERAVRFSHGNRGDDNTTARHRQFISAIEDQISRVEASLREYFNEEGKQPLHWVNLDEDERDELASFLSGTSQSLQSAKDESLEQRPLMISSVLENHAHGKDADLNLNAASDRDVSSINKDGNHVLKIEANKTHGRTEDLICQTDSSTNNARRTWSSPNFGELKIIIPDQDEQINSLMQSVEDTPKVKGSKPVFWKQRREEFPLGWGVVNFFNQVSYNDFGKVNLDFMLSH